MKRLKILFYLIVMTGIIITGWSCTDSNDSIVSTNSNGTDELEFTYIDAHSQPPYPELGDSVNLESIIELMDSNNVAVSILSARQEMQYSMDIGSFAASNPDRIIAAVSLKITSMDNSDQDFLRGLSQQVESGQFTAIAEMLLYHAQKYDSEGNPVAPECFVYPSATTVQAVIDAAEQLGCPVFLHIEFESLEQLYGMDERVLFMTELEQLLTENPARAFVLPHVAELDPDECRSLIETYGNVYFTTNFTDLKIFMNGAPVTNYSEADWNALFEDHQDRFVFALERVFQSQWQAYDTDMAAIQESLSKLSESVAQAIAYNNAARLWNIGQ
jgi:predicted TIM-barrel fold metal-dependent hydrolase